MAINHRILYFEHRKDCSPETGIASVREGTVATALEAVSTGIGVRTLEAIGGGLKAPRGSGGVSIEGSEGTVRSSAEEALAVAAIGTDDGVLSAPAAVAAKTVATEALVAEAGIGSGELGTVAEASAIDATKTSIAAALEAKAVRSSTISAKTSAIAPVTSVAGVRSGTAPAAVGATEAGTVAPCAETVGDDIEATEGISDSEGVEALEVLLVGLLALLGGMLRSGVLAVALLVDLGELVGVLVLLHVNNYKYLILGVLGFWGGS